MRQFPNWLRGRRMQETADILGAVLVATGAVAVLDFFTSAAGLGVVTSSLCCS
jgi:hypothetical protein